MFFYPVVVVKNEVIGAVMQKNKHKLRSGDQWPIHTLDMLHFRNRSGQCKVLRRSNLLLALAALQYNARIILISLKYALSKKSFMLKTLFDTPESAKAATYFKHMNIVAWLWPTSGVFDFHVTTLALEKGIDLRNSGNIVSRFATRDEALAMKQDVLHCVTGGSSVHEVDGLFEIHYRKDENVTN